MNLYGLALLNLAVLVWCFTRGREGDYDFGPAIYALLGVAGTLCLWAGVLLGRWL